MANEETALRPRRSSWFKRLLDTRYGIWWSFAGALGETTVLPIPFEALLLPAMVADRSRAWILAAMALLGSIAGALIGYAVGLFLFDAVGTAFFEWMGYSSAFDDFQSRFAESGFWAVFVIALSPAPIQVATVGSGFLGYSWVWFLAAVIPSRAVRYFGVAILAYALGPRAESFVSRHKRTTGFLTLAAAVLFVAAWIAF